ncbi:MAG: EcoKI restriction-modification system protein HsdS [Candidatus Accumulibacter phosphatis]|uniref:EcoKI restriction-modification system protein HsdS n=1 Tax=Candidatus Accumulibacter phosphatis TaxID=327160 RepID=A0A080LTL0_9PROT|nr:MAG: EcoKI restriction-modification system protein HsdS [Candidatus Accumulibacter phosphatis]
MIADLKPYAEYKESGLPWLGQVPGHWEVRPAFGAFVPNRERNHGMKEKTVLSLSYGRIVIKPAEKLHGLVPESFETYQIVNPGDIVLRTTDLQNDHTSLRVGMVRDRGVITSAYLALRVNAGVSPDFGFQFLNVWDMSKAIYGYGSGLRQGLDFSHFKRMPVAVPPPAEQAAIVRFLDWANGRLERAIRAKRKVIALLNEQKQAIIHRAVTRGLDPSVPLKPSGIPWLGDIPQHWQVRRVKQATRILRGKFSHRPRNDASLYDGQYPFIQTGVVAQASKFITSYSQTLNERGLAVSKLFPRGTLVMTIAANIGEVAVLTFDACFPDSIVGFVPSASADRDYLYMVFLCMKPDLLREAPVNTQGNLNVERIGAMGMPFPPLGEQRQIARRAEAETKSFDSAISRLEREIELLREYRTRLVADVVTGKLDLRAAAARLPQDVAPDDSESDPDLAAELADEAADA